MPALSTVFWTVGLLFIGNGHCNIQHQLRQKITAITRLGQQASSLTFVFDTTSSMIDDRDEIRTASTAILREVMQRDNVPVDNLVLVPFHDPGKC